MGYKTCTTCGVLSAPATRVCKSCDTPFLIHSTTKVTKKRKIVAADAVPRSYHVSAAVNSTPSVVVIGNIEDHNQDTCAVCNDTGRLLCCDVCPLAYHLDCVHLERVPKGAWQCPACRSAQNNSAPTARDASSTVALSSTSSSDAVNSALVDVDVASEMIKVVNGFTFAAYKKLTNSTPQHDGSVSTTSAFSSNVATNASEAADPSPVPSIDVLDQETSSLSVNAEASSSALDVDMPE